MVAGKMYRAPRPLNTKQKKQVYNIINKGKLYRRSRQTVSTSVGTTGQLIEITECSHGDDRNNRLSDEIIVTKIRVQLGATIDIADVGDNDEAPTPEVLQFRLVIAISTMGPLLAADFPSNTLVLPDYDKMIVLYDRTWRRSIYNGDVNVDIKKKFKKGNIPGIKVKYDDSDESETDAQHHPIYAFVISSDNTNQPQYTLLGEMHFYDKN